CFLLFFFFQAEDGIRDWSVTGVQTCALPISVAQSLVQAVDSVGFTVSDVDASVEFFSKVLSFEKVSETEVTGAEYEHLQGVFGRSEERRVGKECGYRWWPYH